MQSSDTSSTANLVLNMDTTPSKEEGAHVRFLVPAHDPQGAPLPPRRKVTFLPSCLQHQRQVMVTAAAGSSQTEEITAPDEKALWRSRGLGRLLPGCLRRRLQPEQGKAPGPFTVAKVPREPTTLARRLELKVEALLEKVRGTAPERKSRPRRQDPQLVGRAVRSGTRSVEGARTPSPHPRCIPGRHRRRSTRAMKIVAPRVVKEEPAAKRAAQTPAAKPAEKAPKERKKEAGVRGGSTGCKEADAVIMNSLLMFGAGMCAGGGGCHSGGCC